MSACMKPLQDKLEADIAKKKIALVINNITVEDAQAVVQLLNEKREQRKQQEISG